MANDYSISIIGVVDYILFVLLFVVSAAIGFYHAFKDRKNTSASNFHLSGRKMHPIPVSMSLTATFMSALTLLGNPTEIYTNGTMFSWIVAAMLIATISSNYLFLPVFYNLNKTSCYGYIEMRFGPAVRTLTCTVYLFQNIIYMGFVLYAPSLAFQAVTGLSLWGTMFGAAFVSTLYTALGGMKTVLWTDSLQLIVMLAGLVTVLVEGSRVTGGFANAWNIANQHGRIEFLDLSPDPRTRHSVWSMMIGAGFFWTYLYGLNQAQVQRACSLSSLRKAQFAVWLNFPGLVAIITLTCMIGVVLFAFYKDCDPLKYGLISRADQMLPLFVLDILGNVPGLTGLFVACVFSGSLSSISSGLNAFSAVLLEDFIKPHWGKQLHGRRELLLSKAFVVVLGCVQFGVAILISQAGGLILQLSYSITSIMTGPIMGLFVSGMIFPWTNRYGAMTGMITSLIMVSWVVFGAAFERPARLTTPLPVSTSACYSDNSTITTSTINTSNIVMTTVSQHAQVEEPVLYDFYRMSYQWYTAFGVVVNVVVSLTVSFFTGRTDPKTVDPKLMIPLFYKIFPCLPERYRRYLQLGIDYNKVESKKEVMGVENPAYKTDNL